MFDSPEWLALCLAVIRQPEDDLPRLMAADWLEEHGQPERAEFIRVQIELTKQPTPALILREKSLWNQPEVGAMWSLEICPCLLSITFDSWSGSAFLGWSRLPMTDIRFRRGFPDNVRTTALHWLNYGHELVPQYPVRTLQLRDCERLTEAQWWSLTTTLDGITDLELNCRVTLAARLLERFTSTGLRLVMPGDSSNPTTTSTALARIDPVRETLMPPRSMLPAN